MAKHQLVSKGIDLLNRFYSFDCNTLQDPCVRNVWFIDDTMHCILQVLYSGKVWWGTLTKLDEENLVNG